MTRLSTWFFLVALLLLSACGDRASQSSQNGAANRRSHDSGVTSAANNTTSGQHTEQQPSSVGIPNANGTTDNSLMAAKNRKIEAMRQSGSDPSSPKTDVETLLKRSTKPAPENSEFSVALTDILVERRTFQNHPILAKVEKITDGPKSTIKLVTRDGRTVELPGTAIEGLSTASVASILRAGRLESPKSSPGTGNPTR